MSLRLIKNQQEVLPDGPEEENLLLACQKIPTAVTLEWIHGQYWLHSDIPKERPIGIEIDKILLRHEEFFKRSSLQKELLARAIGIKGPHRPNVTDLTAGLLGDSLLFLSFGCEVKAVERHPVVAFIIRSALLNAQHPAVNKLTLLEEDAGIYLQNVPPTEVLYFDPMFEDANNKASPRKEMRIFRNVIQEDLDATAVMELALKAGPKRLVVKRPRYSRPLSTIKAVEFLGKATRYDVYFPFDTNLLK